MSQMIDFTVPSTVPGRTLHAFRCVPEGEVKAVLQLSHGMVEFIDRYKPLAEYLAGRGILVTGHDHLGHGGSDDIALNLAATHVRAKADYGYFAEPDGNRAVLADLHAMTVRTKELYPGVPYFLLGHSMGSFYARQYLCEYGHELDGAIIMGTGWQPRAAITGGLAVANAVAAVAGESATSDLVTELAFGSYNKLFAPNRTKVDWLSADESNVDDYIADPLCGADATVGLFRQMLHGIRFNQRMSHLRQMDKDMPVLFVAGDKDPVGSCGRGVRQTCDAFRQAGMRDCTLKLYPGLRHEILNEKAYAAEITKDIETWLLSRLEK